MRDLPAIVAVRNSAFRLDGIEQVETLERMKSTYDNIDPQFCDLARDAVVAEIDGRVVGYGRVEWRPEPDGLRVYSNVGAVDGEHRRRGIGATIFDWGAARIDDVRAAHPTGPKVLESWGYDSAAGVVALLHANGMERVTRDVVMVRRDLRDIDITPMPPGFTVRPPRPDELRKVWESDVEAFRDHWGFVEQTEADYKRFLEFPHNDTTLWRIAWDGDQVAGQVRSFLDADENDVFGRRRGYTEDISVRRPYRGRGLARSLLSQSLVAVRDRGMEEAALSVHVDNPLGAFRLYESVGFEQVASFGTYRKTLE